jgi:hypothetical protein
MITLFGWMVGTILARSTPGRTRPRPRVLRVVRELHGHVADGHLHLW